MFYLSYYLICQILNSIKSLKIVLDRSSCQWLEENHPFQMKIKAGKDGKRSLLGLEFLTQYRLVGIFQLLITSKKMLASHGSMQVFTEFRAYALISSLKSVYLISLFERQGERETGMVQPLIYSPVACNGQVWAEWKPGARACICGPLWGAVAQALEPCPAAC